MSLEEESNTAEILKNHCFDNILIKPEENVSIKSLIKIAADRQKKVSSSVETAKNENKETKIFDNVANLDNKSKTTTESVNLSSIFSRNMILYYSKEFICIFALILTTYATFQNTPPKISRAPTPQPFFSKGSLVHDSIFGSLTQTQHRVSVSELSFVMYYAPWCAESQYSRTSYEHVARLFYREAHFAAINCWQPGGECRLQYQKVQSWPVLMAYMPSGLAVQYQGSWTNSGLTRFVKSLLNPIKRFTDPDELLKQMSGKDAVIVAFIDLKSDKRQYRTFYQTAVKWLEKDPNQEVIFGVVTGASGKNFGVDFTPTIRMFLWNETLEYSGNSSWTQTELNKWINEHIQQVSLWLAPPGTKSSTLAPYLKQGPVFLLFTPRNLYMESNDAYNMIRQIGLEYYNCPKDNWVKEMAKDYIAEWRIENSKNYQALKQKCAKIDMKCNTKKKPVKCSYQNSVSVSFVNTLNSSKLTEFEENNLSSNICEIGPKNKEMYERSCSEFEEDGFCVLQQQQRKSFFSQEENESLKTSMLNSVYDMRSPDNLKQRELKRECEFMFLSELDEPTIFFNERGDENLELMSELGCDVNKTLSFMAIDSVLYHTFAERLGIDILNYENKTAALILDHENESTYRLKGEISLDSVSKFIYDFKKRNLNRSKKSNRVQHKHSHFYKEDEKVKTVNEFKKSKDVSIREIFSENFERNVIGANKTVVVLFHSSQCAFCSLMLQSILTVSQILLKLPKLDFVRIDGDKNDLAWFYTMDSFPSLIIFPEDRKSESRKFPSNIEVNNQNILGFVLANLNRPTRLHAIVLTCKLSKKLFPLEDCLTVLRNEITENISYSLREWRKSPLHRNRILRRLQELQRFYLHILRVNHSCDLNNLEVIVQSIVKIWNSRYSNLFV